VRVALVVYPGALELDFLGVQEPLCALRRIHADDGLRFPSGAPGLPAVEIVGTEKEIRCANGLRVIPDRILEPLQDYQIVVVPGGLGAREIEAVGHPVLLDYLQTVGPAHLLCAVCTGALILAKAGFLKGRRATTHRRAFPTLEKYCQVADQRVVEDGNIITAGGVASSIDLGLYLVEKFYGREARRAAAERMEYWSPAWR
jgi:cyclohexyl-isocyanide hydratase